MDTGQTQQKANNVKVAKRQKPQEKTPEKVAKKPPTKPQARQKTQKTTAEEKETQEAFIAFCKKRDADKAAKAAKKEAKRATDAANAAAKEKEKEKDKEDSSESESESSSESDGEGPPEEEKSEENEKESSEEKEKAENEEEKKEEEKESTPPKAKRSPSKPRTPRTPRGARSGTSPKARRELEVHPSSPIEMLIKKTKKVSFLHATTNTSPIRTRTRHRARATNIFQPILDEIQLANGGLPRRHIPFATEEDDHTLSDPGIPPTTLYESDDTHTHRTRSVSRRTSITSRPRAIYTISHLDREQDRSNLPSWYPTPDDSSQLALLLAQLYDSSIDKPYNLATFKSEFDKITDHTTLKSIYDVFGVIYDNSGFTSAHNKKLLHDALRKIKLIK